MAIHLASEAGARCEEKIMKERIHFAKHHKEENAFIRSSLKFLRLPPFLSFSLARIARQCMHAEVLSRDRVCENFSLVFARASPFFLRPRSPLSIPLLRGELFLSSNLFAGPSMFDLTYDFESIENRAEAVRLRCGKASEAEDTKTSRNLTVFPSFDSSDVRSTFHRFC